MDIKKIPVKYQIHTHSHITFNKCIKKRWLEKPYDKSSFSEVTTKNILILQVWDLTRGIFYYTNNKSNRKLMKWSEKQQLILIRVWLGLGQQALWDQSKKKQKNKSTCILLNFPQIFFNSFFLCVFCYLSPAEMYAFAHWCFKNLKSTKKTIKNNKYIIITKYDHKHI